MINNRLVQGKRARLEIFERGNGPQTIVMVHGYNSSARGWSLIQEALDPDKYRTLAINNRGAGESDRPPDEVFYTVESFAKDLLDIVTTIGIVDFTMIGHSMGAATITRFALDNPGLAQGLILLNSTPLAGRESPVGWELDIENKFHMGAFSLEFGPNEDRIPADFAKQLQHDVARNPLPRAISGRRSMDSLNLRDKLGGLNIPVLVVGGDLDDTVGVDNLLLDFLALPVNRRFLHMFHSVGHSPNFEIPQELAIVMDAFMDRISRL